MLNLNAINEVYDTYWRFAAERLAMYYRRLVNVNGPWSNDPILNSYRFTNTFRAADNVSQYLIKEVQYCNGRSQAPTEIFFRTMLFKIFNKIETWEFIESETGAVSWQSSDLEQICNALDNRKASGEAIYSAAYIMPAPNFGNQRKHANHLALLRTMILDGLPGKISRAKSLQKVNDLLLEYPSLGPFLSFQYTIDLNYSTLIDFYESDFVVAGPGAIDGISKCFGSGIKFSSEEVIYEMTDRQDHEFKRLGLDFPGLFGRRLQPIDCQNLFCEISKYTRVAFPSISGVASRTRIKQQYRRKFFSQLATPFFPPKWQLQSKMPEISQIEPIHAIQLELF